jgi:hypothetical protein
MRPWNSESGGKRVELKTILIIADFRAYAEAGSRTASSTIS